MKAVMNPALSPLRSRLALSEEDICATFQRDRAVEPALEKLTACRDDVVREAAVAHLQPSRVAVFAIGGYGRRESFPGSDLDILLVRPAASSTQDEQPIKDFLHLLWDLGFRLGQQVWTFDELASVGLEDVEFLLSLLDCRALCGDQETLKGFQESIWPERLEHLRDGILQHLRRLTAERHRSYGDTIYQLEPDLKISPGALRDYWTSVWIQRLSREAVFLPEPPAELHESYNLICRLRFALHASAGRPQDQLTHRLQDEVAGFLGFGEGNTSAAVESLMNGYFISARIVAGFCRRTLQLSSRPGGYQLTFFGGSSESEEMTASQILRLFRRCLDENCALSEPARIAVARARDSFSRTLSDDEATRQLRLLLKPKTGLYRVLSEMYELGLLELVLPEFTGIKALLIRDFYHRFTVDEHTLQAVKNIEDLTSEEKAEDTRFQSLLAEVERPELLTLALLLHDVGKAQGPDHSQKSAVMAVKTLKRLGLESSEIDRIVGLIRDHLLMSTVIFRRDLDDRNVIGRFSDQVPDPEQLRMLCLLTYADIGAVGPGVLTGWKKDLLFQLYIEAYNHLTQGFGRVKIGAREIGRRLVSALPEGLDPPEFSHFLEGFPKRYLTATSDSEIFQHFRLAAEVRQSGKIAARLSSKKGRLELCVVSPDRSNLFATIAGSLAYFDMNILRGYGFSNRQNLVLDLIQFEDPTARFDLNPEEKSNFRTFLMAAIGGGISLDDLLKRKEQGILVRRPPGGFEPKAYFGTSPSEDYSILEILAPDSRGLLYRIGRALATAACNIELILISTEGQKAVDVFYLSRQGQQLSQDLRGELPQKIIESIKEQS